MAKPKGKAQIEKLNRKLERLEVVYVPIDSIRANAYNPNRQSEHDFALLRKSMEEDGFTQPIIVLADDTIVDGEHRWRMAAELGYTEVPVVKTDMTAEQARISTLRHNRARGSEDMDLTAAVMRDLQALGAIEWAQDSLMLDDVELNRLLDDIPAADALAGEDYSGAWIPGSGAGGDAERGGAPITHDATPAALSAQREAERAAQAATSEEERQQARKELDLYRVSVTFSGSEAGVVKRVLGDRPAQAILDLCIAADKKPAPRKRGASKAA